MLCMFLFHIDYTIYANYVLIKTTMSCKRYRTHYKYMRKYLDTIGSDSIFVKHVYTWGKSSRPTLTNK